MSILLEALSTGRIPHYSGCSSGPARYRSCDLGYQSRWGTYSRERRSDDSRRLPVGDSKSYGCRREDSGDRTAKGSTRCSLLFCICRLKERSGGSTMRTMVRTATSTAIFRFRSRLGDSRETLRHHHKETLRSLALDISCLSSELHNSVFRQYDHDPSSWTAMVERMACTLEPTPGSLLPWLPSAALLF